MKRLHGLIAAGALVAGLFGAATAMAADPPAAPAARTGDAVCTRCHDASDDKPILSIYQTRHGVKGDGRTPGCQSCHGASDDHVKNTGGKSVRNPPDVTFGLKAKTAAATQSDTCTTCHKGGARSHWDGSQHASRDIPCAACHSVHAAKDKVLTKATQTEVCFTCHKTERAQTHRFSSHPVDAGKMGCSDCHNAHGSTGPKLLAKNSVNETCYTCHAEKRGPFLFEHSPVQDDCTTCHTPHGSNNTALLKTRLPFMCQQCHQDHGASLKSGASIPNAPGTPPVNTPTAVATFGKVLSVQGNGRMCLNCHVTIHGSNHPAGSFFNR